MQPILVYLVLWIDVFNCDILIVHTKRYAGPLNTSASQLQMFHIKVNQSYLNIMNGTGIGIWCGHMKGKT